MKAFVTGGSGHIGYHLVRDLLDKGYLVRCLHHSKTDNFKDLNVEIVLGDLLSIESMYSLMKDVDVVFHLAAVVSYEDKDQEQMNKINVEGTKAIALAAKKANIKKFIHFSSIHVFAHTNNYQILDEKNPLTSAQIDPMIDSYTLSKVEAHKFMLDQAKNGQDVSIIIPTAVIGPHPTLGTINNIIKRFSKKKVCLLVDGGFNWVDARDVSKAAIACVEKGNPGGQYIIAGSHHSIKNIVKIVQKLLMTRIITFITPIWIVKLLIPLLYLIPVLIKGKIINKYSLRNLCNAPMKISDKLAREQLDHNPRPFIETIKDILEL